MATILIVDDDPVNQQVLQMVLQSVGFNVLQELTAEGAIKTTESRLDEIRLVLLDVTLPRLSGFDVCAEIRKMSKTLPILMLSARKTATDVERAKEVGANGYHSKPFDRTELIAAINAELDKTDGTVPAEAETTPPLDVPPVDDGALASVGLVELDSKLIAQHYMLLRKYAGYHIAPTEVPAGTGLSKPAMVVFSDALQAINWALDLQKHANANGGAVRATITSDMVTVKPPSSDGRARITGDAVDAAAKLSSNVLADEVLLCGNTAQLLMMVAGEATQAIGYIRYLHHGFEIVPSSSSTLDSQAFTLRAIDG